MTTPRKADGRAKSRPRPSPRRKPGPSAEIRLQSATSRNVSSRDAATTTYAARRARFAFARTCASFFFSSIL